MISQYRIPNEATKYILFQRTHYIVFRKILIFRVLKKLVPLISYERLTEIEAKIRSSRIKEQYLEEMQKEYRSIRKFLPVNCEKILDVGCGIAGIDIYLSTHYFGKKIDFYLLDKTYIEKRIYYKFEKKGAFYNSLEVAKNCLVSNGVSSNRVHILEATDGNDINISGGIDLILSLLSWGFHYPVETYLDNAYTILNNGGILIMDIRKESDGLGLLAQKFGRYQIIVEESKYFRVRVIK